MPSIIDGASLLEPRESGSSCYSGPTVRCDCRSTVSSPVESMLSQISPVRRGAAAPLFLKHIPVSGYMVALLNHDMLGLQSPVSYRSAPRYGLLRVSRTTLYPVGPSPGVAGGIHPSTTASPTYSPAACLAAAACSLVPRECH